MYKFINVYLKVSVNPVVQLEDQHECYASETLGDMSDRCVF